MKTKTIQGNWVMKKDEIIEGDLKVEGNISGKDGNRYNLIVKGNLDCLDLDCLDLDCWDLDCWDLNCGDLNCWDLECLDLDCWDLNCGNLNFYAVAFAYNSFKCKSVKGRRENHKYFCLDKEVEVTG